jgi:regulator of RNase E activity RraA
LVDGCVRDVDEIVDLPLPVFARGDGICPFWTHLEMVAVIVPVEFAGIQIQPGDIKVSEGDGLVGLPGNHANDVLFQTVVIAVVEQEMEEVIKCQVPVEEIV